MTDTNALLSICFTLITQFTNIVQVPPEAVPQSSADLQKWVLGSPSSPIDAYLVHPKGTRFWIRDGIVKIYESPGSYFQRSDQDPKQISRFFGEAQLTSNQVVELATSTLRRLVKTGDPLAKTPDVMKASGKKENPINFYEITWPATDRDYGSGAKIEIDARTGQIPYLSLIDEGFCDFPFAQQIRSRVYWPDPVREITRQDTTNSLSRPDTNRVSITISNWLQICRLMKINPGSQTKLTDVNWAKTIYYIKNLDSSNEPMYGVRFNNNTLIEAIDGKVLSYMSPDYTSDGQQYLYQEARKPFVGRINHDWKKLATNFEQLLIKQFAIPEQTMSQFSFSSNNTGRPELGSADFARLSVGWWRVRVKRPGASEGQLLPLLMVEFDLRSGEIKAFSFDDEEFIELFGRRQAKAN